MRLLSGTADLAPEGRVHIRRKTGGERTTAERADFGGTKVKAPELQLSRFCCPDGLLCCPEKTPPGSAQRTVGSQGERESMARQLSPGEVRMLVEVRWWEVPCHCLRCSWRGVMGTPRTVPALLLTPSPLRAVQSEATTPATGVGLWGSLTQCPSWRDQACPSAHVVPQGLAHSRCSLNLGEETGVLSAHSFHRYFMSIDYVPDILARVLGTQPWAKQATVFVGYMLVTGVGGKGRWPGLEYVSLEFKDIGWG